MDTVERLSKIYHEVQKLKAEHSRLLTDNTSLKSENEELKKEVQTLKESIEEIKQKNLNLQAGEAINSRDIDNEEIKAKIDKYVKDIDKCLENLKMH